MAEDKPKRPSRLRKALVFTSAVAGAVSGIGRYEGAQQKRHWEEQQRDIALAAQTDAASELRTAITQGNIEQTANLIRKAADAGYLEGTLAGLGAVSDRAGYTGSTGRYSATSRIAQERITPELRSAIEEKNVGQAANLIRDAVDANCLDGTLAGLRQEQVRLR